MKSKAICILGMHRSGTSTVTRAVNFLGAYIGEEKDMVEPGFDNPEGFWELRDVVALHKGILSALKRGENEIVSPLPSQWHLRAEMSVFREELRALILTHFDGHSLWAWKDPRTCLTFDLWKDSLKELGIDLVVVFVVRNPQDVANSLKKRNLYAFEKSFGIWLNHNISALESIAGIPAVFLSYDRFLEGWEPEMRRCALAIGMPWPSDEQAIREKMRSFVKPELRHSKSTSKDLESVPAPVKELYNLLMQQTTAIKSESSFPKVIERLSREFRDYASFFCTDVEAAIEKEKQVVAQMKKLADQEARLRVKEQRISECERQLAEKK